MRSSESQREQIKKRLTVRSNAKASINQTKTLSPPDFQLEGTGTGAHHSSKVAPSNTSAISRYDFLIQLLKAERPFWNRNVEKKDSDKVMQKVMAKDWTNGVRPSDPITRVEAATMLAKFHEIYDTSFEQDVVYYNDVFADDASWQIQGIYACKKYGLFAGYKDNTFRPNEGITLEQALDLVQRQKQLKTKEEQINYLDEGVKPLFQLPQSLKSLYDSEKGRILLEQYPKGSFGGQCVKYAREFAPDLPTGLWTLQDKIDLVVNGKEGVNREEWLKTGPMPGDVIVQDMSTGPGHVAVVLEVLADDTFVVTESNWKEDEKVSHDRILKNTDKSILGAWRSE